VNAAAALGIPYESFFHLGNIGGTPIQWFGVIVACGVLIGASLLRRYGEWHGIVEDDIRSLGGWIMATGFLGAHLFDCFAYQWKDVQEDPLIIIQIWKGISSYGGFIGGAMGFAFFVWWKRHPPRLFADTAIVGLLPAFSIGRIGCTLVSDHIGAAVDTSKWYAPFAIDYPRNLNMDAIHNLVVAHPGPGEFIRAWNLGLIELMYLVPVNAVILWLAFRPKQRLNAGFLIVLTGVLYAPVRFFLDFLRPEESDPRYSGLTFAQWASFLAFGAAVYVAIRIFKNGAPAEIIAPTSGEAQRALQQDYEKAKDEASKASSSASSKKK
jgi:phosphatidylglycerol:prolipoprotein diacylglycerol transferase